VAGEVVVLVSGSLIAIVCVYVAAIPIPRFLHRYFIPAQYERVAARYGLKRGRWEPIDVWEDRIWRMTERRLDTSEALTNEASTLGLIRYFPPGQRPSMPAGVTWTTGIDFARWQPFVVWLPDEHPLAGDFRLAHGVIR
jgi:hypothetical protein